MRPSLSPGLAACLLLMASSLASPASAKDRIEFNRDVRPILSENCYACHGPDKGQRKARLRLDEREAAVRHGAVRPGNPDDSELILRILSEDEDVMPPAEAHKTLSTEQKQTLHDWIAQGAEYQAHWAYVPPARSPLPEVRREGWVRNPIDAFLLANLEANHVDPSPEASRGLLIRRLSLDLLGLPPTPAEVSAFEQDSDPKAFEKLVGRLLDSPHYGERMAVPWLDLARFTDTVGYHGDQGQRVFPYRDYVVDAFNRNKPFDAFVIEQLAGDLLPEPTPEQLVATGFNRLNMMTREGGAQPGEYLAKYAADRVRTVAQTFLGSTFGCAECHDHKYDPITQRDFYTMSAFFADVKQWGVYNDYDYTPNPELKGWSNDHPFPPEIEVESPYLQTRRARLVERLRELADRPAGPSALAAWTQELRDFLGVAENGWRVLEPKGGQGSILPDGSLLVSDEKPEPRAKGRAADRVFESPAGAGWVARIRVEVLPPEPGGRIVRDGIEAASVALSATVRSEGAQARPALKFHLADADRKSPRYFNGDEVPGVLAGWRTSKQEVDRPQTAAYCLDTPMQLGAGETLVVTIKSSEALRLRVSLSPFGLTDEGDPLGGPDDEDRAAVLADESQRTPEQASRVRRLFHRGTAADAEAWSLAKSIAREIQACRGGRAYSLVTQSAAPLETRVLPRGDWQDRSGEIVEPEVPAFLPHETVARGRRLTRLDLARWITAPENPLTARVFVNRLWKQIFGVGISGVMEDVGAQGEWPVHPELLDWLAVEFRESGWDVKRMVRLMVTSSAYRQDSRTRPELKDLDPGNRWVAFLTPRRLEAEFVRDGMLAVAGLLDPEVGGPSAFPYQPAGYYANIQFPNRDYIASEGELQYRRGLYAHWQRTFLHPMLANFDAPAREECTASRNSANTPQQALTLLNDPSFVEGARVLAARLVADDGPAEDGARLERLFRIVLARPPRPAERDSLLAYLSERRRAFQEDPAFAVEFLKVGQAPAPAGIEPAEAAAWAATCRVVLNLHETITRY